MTAYVLDLDPLDVSAVMIVGGKGAQLGALSRVEGVRVPAGFCVTTSAFERVMAAAPSIPPLLEQLSRLDVSDQEALCALSAELRQTLEEVVIPDEVVEAIREAHRQHGEAAAYATRSSATAEDAPTTSFAGQHDTSLNIVGLSEILRHVSRCWASLFTARAVTYRLRHGLDLRKAQMAVVVQRMVFADAAGVLFTADPITGDREVASVEATFGLGEALVSGMINPDVYKVRGDALISKVISCKPLEIKPSSTGGTQQQMISSARQTQPALTDSQLLELVALGRRIAVSFGCPQDLEWCLAHDELYIVQSRPISTLFPIPESADGLHHVYVSVGHQQMMTDAMKPLGLSMWQLMAGRRMHEAGGRLFVEVTQALATPAGRDGLLSGLGRSDPLIGDALRSLIARDDLMKASLHEPLPAPPAMNVLSPASIATDPALVTALIGRFEAALEASVSGVQEKSGLALLEFILNDIKALKQLLFDPTSIQIIMAGIEAAWWINDRLKAWLGETNAVDTLTQSVHGNITSEMGLALLDVADVLRPRAAVVASLQQLKEGSSLEALSTLTGGQEAYDVICAWLDKYGVRGVGEIDITRPRFSERPMMLVPMLLCHIRGFEQGEGARRFEQGLQRARLWEAQLLARLRALPDGAQKAQETKLMIDRVRAFAGYREYPKYGMVSRTFVYKQALLAEAARLKRAGVLHEEEDIFYLRFEELQDVARTGQVNVSLISARKDAFRSYQSLRPPRVLTSDGEEVVGAYQSAELPADALVGLAVSTGTVEGRARVIFDLAQANLDADDILVTVFTDPSWTPLFIALKGLVTEVGGLMTHGAVIAREYGLPAVVGVVNATTLIKDGQRIRVNGTRGYVELL